MQLQMLLNVEKNQVMYFLFWVFFFPKEKRALYI